jgi:hypothetical protein
MEILFDITQNGNGTQYVGLGMKYWVFGHFDAIHIVTKHNNWSWLDIVDFIQKFP